MLFYSGLAVVGELGSDDVHIFWLLFFMDLFLPFVIWITLVFAGLGACLEFSSFVSVLLQVSW